MHMHNHSLEAYAQITETGVKDSRAMAILEVFKNAGKPLRDWDVLKRLFPESDNLNLVRPRITELHQMGHLVEGPPMKNQTETVNVRTSLPAKPDIQQTLFE